MRPLLLVSGTLLVAYGAAYLHANTPSGGARLAFLCDPSTQRQAALLWSASGPGGRSASLEAYTRLLARDPGSPYSWAQAAFAWLDTGDQVRSRLAIRRAEQISPRCAPALMQALHYHLLAESSADLLRIGARILALTGVYDSFVFNYYDRLDIPAESILLRGLPLDRRAAAAFLDHVVARGDQSSAAVVWNWLSENRLADQGALLRYTGFLSTRHNYKTAWKDWCVFHQQPVLVRGSNMIFNSRLELPLGIGLFDWRVQPLAGSEVTIDSQATYQGVASLRVQFFGQDNLDFHHVSHFAYASSNSLRLSALVKCDKLTTDEGVALRLYDSEDPSRFDYTTEGIKGTADWRQIDHAVTLPPGTRLVELQIVRHRSLKFDNKIRGIAWFNQISLAAGTQ